MVVDDALAVAERTGAGRGLSGGQEGVPDHPGVDSALLESGAPGGRNEVLMSE